MYQGKCQGCGGYGEVDDINLCDDCAEDLEKQDNPDNEQIAEWAERKEISKQKKKENREKSLAILRKRKIPFITLSEGAGHYRIGDYDFWPSTGKIYNRKIGKAYRGVFTLIDLLNNEKKEL